ISILDFHHTLDSSITLILLYNIYLKELSALAFFSSLSFILVSSKPNKLYLELSFNYLKLSEYNLAIIIKHASLKLRFTSEF
ncbi:hypothetical protein, partial [Francisella noatunensis]